MSEIEYTTLPGSETLASRIGLGTRRLADVEEEKAIATILKALESGITVIDTAPLYGFGNVEELVGKAVQLSDTPREDIILSTKVGVEWNKNGNTWRNSSPERIEDELKASMQRLQTDYIDIYHVNWPDPKVPIEETATKMKRLFDDNRIKAIGVSNHTPDQMNEFREYAPIHINQLPYNLFERGIEEDVFPYCQSNDIKMMSYGSLCRGLLTGKFDKDSEFKKDDARNLDPKFSDENIESYLNAVEKLRVFGIDKSLEPIHLAIRWLLDTGIEVALWGATSPEQIDDMKPVMLNSLNGIERKSLNRIVEREFDDPFNRPLFLAPPVEI